MFRVSKNPVQGMITRKPDEESQAPQQPQEEAPYKVPTPPYADPAEPILRAHKIDSETAASIWDAYHQAHDSKELMHALINVNVPNELKAELYAAKRKHDAAPGWLDRVQKVVDIINHHLPKLNQPDRSGKSAASTAEKHPNVLAAFLNAGKKDEADNE